jgi:predicted LPLAT superfamily acyltransferase
MSTRTQAAAEWTQRPERGTLAVAHFLAWLALAFGRPATRLLVHCAALYFLATGGPARRCTRVFLERVLGRRPTLAEHYRLFFAICATVHDRAYFLSGRFDLFEVTVKGAELFDDAGALLMGGHVGSFEALRACGRELGQRRVAMAMYQVNSRLFGEVLARINPNVNDDVVALGRPQSMIELAHLLEQGALVGMLADRTRGDEPTIDVPFLGANAPLPTGPMRVAAALRARVLFMAGLYRGGNRYEVRFEPLADFGGVDGMTRAERDAAVREAVAAYARRLEQVAREAPDNWFNFHDFRGGAK